MQQITLTRALKLKNRVQARIRQITNDMSANNSLLKGADPDINVAETMVEYDRLVQFLINLKVAIFRANAPIYEQILRLAEAKSKIGVLRTLDTRHGRVADRYVGEPVEYEAAFRKTEVDNIIRGLEQRIDSIQEALDKHNHTVSIEVESIDF